MGTGAMLAAAAGAALLATGEVDADGVLAVEGLDSIAVRAVPTLRSEGLVKQWNGSVHDAGAAGQSRGPGISDCACTCC
ncbi:hypothetical protein V8E36_009018 [Tilletia maclaganii]